MKNKIITIILTILLIASIGGNIYQYIATSNLASNLSTLTNTKNELTAEIETKTEELNNLTSELDGLNEKISELKTSIETLQTDNESLMAELSDDEYQGDTEGGVRTLDETLSFIEEEYKNGNMSEEMYQGLLEAYQKRLENGSPLDIELPPSHIDAPRPEGAVEYDPANDGDYEFGQGGEVPDHLKGAVVK